MPSLLRHVRVLWRLESGIAEGRIRLIVRRSVLLVLAAVTALFGLGMLNVAAFLALESRWGPIWGATATALGDFVIAAAFAAIAATSRPGAELRAAIALRQATMDGIEDEFSTLRDRIALPIILVPLITAIIRGLRKKKPDPQ